MQKSSWIYKSSSSKKNPEREASRVDYRGRVKQHFIIYYSICIEFHFRLRLGAETQVNTDEKARLCRNMDLLPAALLSLLSE